MAKDNNNSRINQILENLSSAASVAADGVSDAVQSAGNVVSGKYDNFKLNMELNRLQDEQEQIFSDIGRTMFKLQCSDPTEEKENANELVDVQQEVDHLLLLADQKQQEIDFTADQIFKLSGNVVCEDCGKVCSGKDVFCSCCGSKLPKKG